MAKSEAASASKEVQETWTIKRLQYRFLKRSEVVEKVGAEAVSKSSCYMWTIGVREEVVVSEDIAEIGALRKRERTMRAKSDVVSSVTADLVGWRVLQRQIEARRKRSAGSLDTVSVNAGPVANLASQVAATKRSKKGEHCGPASSTAGSTRLPSTAGGTEACDEDAMSGWSDGHGSRGSQDPESDSDGGPKCAEDKVEEVVELGLPDTEEEEEIDEADTLNVCPSEGASELKLLGNTIKNAEGEAFMKMYGGGSKGKSRGRPKTVKTRKSKAAKGVKGAQASQQRMTVSLAQTLAEAAERMVMSMTYMRTTSA